MIILTQSRLFPNFGETVRDSFSEGVLEKKDGRKRYQIILQKLKVPEISSGPQLS
jgi:hypothetical protein